MDEAEKLIREGYCAISNSGLIVARLDRPDWGDAMAKAHVHGFPGDQAENLKEGQTWVNALGLSAADHYRRVYSRDKLEVSKAIYQRIKKANQATGVITFRPLLPDA